MIKKLSFLWPFIFIIQNVFGQANVLYIDGGLFKIDSQVVVHVNGNLSISDGEPFTSYGTLNVTGNVLDNGNVTTIGGNLRLIGNSPQTLDCLYFFNIGSVEFNNPSGITLNKSLKINGECSFVSGIITPTLYSVTFGSNGYVSSTNPPSDNSHINGEVTKLGIGTFTYPVGDGTKYQKVRTDLSINDEGIHVTYVPSDAGAATFSNAGSDTSLLVWYNPSEHWLIKNQTNVTGTVTLYWDGYRDSVKGGILDQRVAHQDGDWLNEGTNGTGSFSAGSVTSNVISSWSPFTLGTISIATPLPIFLIDFKCNAMVNYNLLQWTTGTEEKDNLIEVQKSKDAINFETIETFLTKGETNNQYHYKDYNIDNGNVFYRLKMPSKNKEPKISKTIKINRNDKSFKENQLFPNPCKNELMLVINDNELKGSNATITDIIGNTLQQFTITDSKQKLNTYNLPPGEYFINLQSKATLKFIKSSN